MAQKSPDGPAELRFLPSFHGTGLSSAFCSKVGVYAFVAVRQSSSSSRNLDLVVLPPLDASEVERLSARLSEVVPKSFFEDAEKATGVAPLHMLGSVVEQIRRAAMFAASDDGDMPENIRAVEKLLRTGRVEMVAEA